MTKMSNPRNASSEANRTAGGFMGRYNSSDKDFHHIRVLPRIKVEIALAMIID
jgi:hypothetical protein